MDLWTGESGWAQYHYPKYPLYHPVYTGPCCGPPAGVIRTAAWADLPRVAVTLMAHNMHSIFSSKDPDFVGAYGGTVFFLIIYMINILILEAAIQEFVDSQLTKVINKRHTWFEVIRGGRSLRVSLYDIDLGDVAPLEVGDQVPGDGVLISGHSLAIDEFNLIGKRKIVHINSKYPFLRAGCIVTKGSGTMLVDRVGLSTMWGNLMRKEHLPIGEETPLQIRMNGFATSIAKVGSVVAVATFVGLLLRYFILGQFKFGKTSSLTVFGNVLYILSTAIAVLIFAIPDALPRNITRMIAYLGNVMADKALIRRLSAGETMGCATTICTNKIELLSAKMKVSKVYITRGGNLDPLWNSQVSFYLKSLLIEGISCNTNGFRYSPAETAIRQWAIDELRMHPNNVRSSSSILHIVPFSSLEKKRGVAVWQKSNSKVHIHWNGDADVVLASCTKYMDSNNNRSIVMDDKKRTLFKEAIEDFGTNNMHSVGIAFKEYNLKDVPTSEEGLNNWDLPGNDLTLLALVALKDPCRPGMKDLVKKCQVAGVKIRLITEDNLQRAKAIALECGILDPHEDASEPLLIEGARFRSFSRIEREKIAEKVVVMGSSTPSDKLLLVQSLKMQGQVVAVTGSTPHDASALNEADVGIAMNMQGTHAAKESSDVIIMDDNFGSIVELIMSGRSMFANIQKHVHFQLTVTIAAMVINLLFAFFWGDAVLNVIQLFWIGTMVEVLGASAFITEPPTDGLMLKPPIGRREHFVTNVMWRNIFVQVCYQVSIILVFGIWGRGLLHLENDLSSHAVQVKNTMIFNIFVLCQVFNIVNARKHDEPNIFLGIYHNMRMLVYMSVILAFQVIIIFFMGVAFNTTPLDLNQWIISIVCAFISWPVAQIGQYLPVPSEKLVSFSQKAFPFHTGVAPRHS